MVHWGRNGGGPRFAADAVRALRSTGTWTALSLSKQSERAALDRAAADEVLVLPTFRSAAGAVLGTPRALENARRVRAFVRRHRIDCVFAAMEQIWQPAVAAVLRGTDTPYLLGMHDASFHPGDESTLRGLTRRLEVDRADGLLTFSRSVQEAVAEREMFPSDRVWRSFLPASGGGSVDDRRGAETPVRFGFFGRWQAYKGITVLVDAARLLRQRGYAFTLEIWGDGKMDLGDRLPDGVTLHRGWIPESAVERTVGRFDVLIAPYQEASQSGVVPLAAALGVPAVVTPVGGLTEQVLHDRSGLIADGTGAGPVADALERLLREPGLLSRLSAGAAQQTATERSLERFGAELLQVLEQLTLAGKRAA